MPGVPEPARMSWWDEAGEDMQEAISELRAHFPGVLDVDLRISAGAWTYRFRLNDNSVVVFEFDIDGMPIETATETAVRRLAALQGT